MILAPDTRVASRRSVRQVLLLAPSLEDVPTPFCNLVSSPQQYARLLMETQRLRGGIYLDDGAIRPEELTSDGRHIEACDLKSWHILTLDESGSVQGCARCHCRRQKVAFSELGLGRSALALSDRWGNKIRRAVEDTIDRVVQSGHAFGELGGWAIAEHLRCTTTMMRIALSTWALVRSLDIHFLCSTATRRHCSAAILRKLGGRAFEADGAEVPHYWEPRYGCEMELLRFDHLDDAHPLFEPRVQEFQNLLATMPVICRGPRPGAGRREFAGFALQPELDLIAHA